ncbi:protease complex subunit PrcB family protein [Winogradskyella sp.]|uniref:protease complex subunit PrcB family protein n=1 Tax=Winogradskyella sp. TaxID=1883156 RepID=UPI0025EB7DF4|nr:protease complex subunit PrcB family protein [Winogradskyella sp.]
MKNLLLFIVLFCVFNCKTNMENANAENAKKENSEMRTTEFNVIAKGNLYGSGSEGIVAQNLVITNQNDWDKLISQMNSVNKVSDSFKETNIDFSKHTIIAVFDEVKGSGGHSLELTITTNSENTIVNITKIAPNGVATSVMTQPYYIIKIAKRNLPIEFITSF